MLSFSVRNNSDRFKITAKDVHFGNIKIKLRQKLIKFVKKLYIK